jgi:hypothetical protein
MGIAAAAIFLFLLSMKALQPELLGVVDPGGTSRIRTGLSRTSALLRELEECLAAGLLPGQERWEQVRALPEPWGKLAHESLSELRSRGGQVLPTLKRLRSLADSQAEDLLEGKARSASAMAQALTCAAMVPLLSGALYFLLPALEEHRVFWIGASAFALAWSGAGALWLLRMAETARWGGLAQADRPGLLSAYCTSERILALIRSGVPPDLAWSHAMDAFRREPTALSRLWCPSVWATEGVPEASAGPLAIRALQRAGESIRRAIQCALLEGRPSVERIEAAAASLRHEMSAAVDRELSLLPTRALKPLFICVAPSLIGLLGCAILILWADSSGGSGGILGI